MEFIGKIEPKKLAISANEYDVKREG